MPRTIDGIPIRVSTERRATLPSLLFPRSERNIPAMTPRGTETTVAMTTRMSVPTIALEIPPPGSPIGFGSSVRNCQLMEDAPRTMMNARIRSSGNGRHEGQGQHQPAKGEVAAHARRDAGVECGRGDAPLRSSCQHRRHPVHDDLPRDVDQGADDEKEQGDLDEACQVHVAGRL